MKEQTKIQIVEWVALAYLVWIGSWIVWCVGNDQGGLGVVSYAVFWAVAFIYMELREETLESRIIKMCEKQLRVRGIYKRIEYVTATVEK